MQKKHIGGLTVTNLASKHYTTHSAHNSSHTSLERTLVSSLQVLKHTCKITTCFTLASLIVLTLAIATIGIRNIPYYGLVRTAYAKTTPADSKNTNNSKVNNKQFLDTNPHSRNIELSIVQATPVVTDKSGYHLTATLKANTVPLPEGTVQLAINSSYTFVSRTDVQNWAQGESLIPTPQILGSAKITKLPAGSTTTIRFDIPSNKQELQSIWHWGPKPLKITYFSQDYSRYKSIYSFLTRSNAGMHATSSPAMNLTAVMPILAATQRIVKDGTVQPNFHADVTLQAHKNDVQRILEKADLISKHTKLQTIADANTLQAAHSLMSPSAYMQRNGFDISAYADDYNDSIYRFAGIDKADWSARSSLFNQTNPTAKNSSNLHKTQHPNETTHTFPQSYAWQTHGNWTLAALMQAKRNGYNTVIATNEFDASASQFAVSNGVYDINTPAGNVRVLAPQLVLTTLANGKPTSTHAVSERTQAGRINRLIAQSAFYQMEQPYISRNILITFSNNTSVSSIDAVMNALEQSPWLSLSSLNTMARLEQNTLPYWKQNSIMRAIPHSSGISAKSASLRRSTLKNLAHRRQDVIRLTKHILDYNAANQSHNTEGDAQALAKQTAKTKKTMNAKTWGEHVLQLYDDIAFHELANNTTVQSHTITLKKSNTQNKQFNKSDLRNDTAQYFTSALLNKIRIIPPRGITAVSETASMPVTISNAHPYPVRVYLSADTHAMEIVTRRKTLVNIPANSETQVTLPLRITTSIHTQATFVLEDRQHRIFSQQQRTLITSTLQISDKSGTIIIIFAFMLGALGLWRQFHRKKDPDE